ncbi:MAG: methylenetetrahydrofolate reductase [NAD(P)H] [Gammaproteobacteria bacterium]|nr:methylenetetrahydrofolate reductase [NAD(P)H] [Gammaproteobacteria bacterium]
MKHNSLRISFEFYPPKTDEGHKNLQKAALAIAKVEPDFFSVTYGAGGSLQNGTVAVVKELQKSLSVPVAPHLTCINSTREEISSLLTLYKSLGVKRIVALRGDLPAGVQNTGELKFASDLIHLIRDTTQDYFQIEVGAYPEFHPQSQNALDDVLNFKKKVEAGATNAITQYFYNPDAYFNYIDYCAKLGIYIPIIPGIMPITHFEKLARFSALCGAEIPQWIAKRLSAYGDDEESVQAFGLEVVYDLCQRLIAGGAPGLHFYTLNQAEVSLRLLKLLNVTVPEAVKYEIEMKA